MPTGWWRGRILFKKSVTSVAKRSLLRQVRRCGNEAVTWHSVHFHSSFSDGTTSSSTPSKGLMLLACAFLELFVTHLMRPYSLESTERMCELSWKAKLASVMPSIACVLYLVINKLSSVL